MLTHLIELRRRTLHTLIAFVTLFLLFFFLSPQLFHRLMMPLLQVLPKDYALIAMHITTPLLTPIQLAANAALLCTTPYALLQIWYFVSPGLYRQERRQLQLAMISSVVLFCMGVLFCFYVVLPFMLQCFAQAVPPQVRFMPDMAYAVDFITRMLLLFGLCFQVPLVCFSLVQFQLTSVQTLKNVRPYVIVGAFTIGMLLTPPDVLSQIMLAVPLCVLYESGIFLAALSSQPERI